MTDRPDERRVALLAIQGAETRVGCSAGAIAS
jgi:hypothetical protein